MFQLPKYETWNSNPCIRCTVITMEPEKLLHFSTIFSDASCVTQDIRQKSAFSHLQSTMLANPASVVQYFEYASSHGSLHEKTSRPLVGSSGKARLLLLTEPHSYTWKVSRRNFERNSRLKKSKYSGKVQIGLEEVVWLVL